jgi:Tfp pilus assembly protein PilW
MAEFLIGYTLGMIITAVVIGLLLGAREQNTAATQATRLRNTYRFHP